MYDPVRGPGGEGVTLNDMEMAAGEFLIDLFTKRSRDPTAEVGGVRGSAMRTFGAHKLRISAPNGREIRSRFCVRFQRICTRRS